MIYSTHWFEMSQNIHCHMGSHEHREQRQIVILKSINKNTKIIHLIPFPQYLLVSAKNIYVEIRTHCKMPQTFSRRSSLRCKYDEQYGNRRSRQTKLLFYFYYSLQLSLIIFCPFDLMQLRHQARVKCNSDAIPMITEKNEEIYQ